MMNSVFHTLDEPVYPGCRVNRARCMTLCWLGQPLPKLRTNLECLGVTAESTLSKLISRAVCWAAELRRFPGPRRRNISQEAKWRSQQPPARKKGQTMRVGKGACTTKPSPWHRWLLVGRIRRRRTNEFEGALATMPCRLTWLGFRRYLS